MKKYFLHGCLKARSGQRQKLADILLEASRLLSDDPGCNLYAIGFSDKEEDAVYITEIWETKENHDNSLKSPDVQNLIKQAIPLVEGAPEKGQELMVIGGKGID